MGFFQPGPIEEVDFPTVLLRSMERFLTALETVRHLKQHNPMFVFDGLGDEPLAESAMPTARFSGDQQVRPTGAEVPRHGRPAARGTFALPLAGGILAAGPDAQHQR